MSTFTKLSQLETIIRRLKNVLIAFSGGVDSYFLLKVSTQTLGPDRVVAATASSELVLPTELDEACQLAAGLAVEHVIISTRELDYERFAANPPDRCYHCKIHRYSELIELARSRGIPWVADGTNFSDLADYRPGLKAVRELDIRTPLAEASLTKDDIRFLSKSFGLPTWNKPAEPCLATRIPYGVRITRDVLGTVRSAEEVLRQLGFAEFRVRHHLETARIELPKPQFARMLDTRIAEQVVARIKQLGYKYVALDLEGYRSGSLNELLK